jgi:hypothetical protein
MARKIALRTVPAIGDSQPFIYGDVLLTILTNPPTGRGLTLDEVIRALDVVKPIEAAIKADAAEVILSDTQWATLKEKLDIFQFAFAHRAIPEFGLMIRQAPELGTEEAPARKIRDVAG